MGVSGVVVQGGVEVGDAEEEGDEEDESKTGVHEVAANHCAGHSNSGILDFLRHVCCSIGTYILSA
jgi:hypothetical protein